MISHSFGLPELSDFIKKEFSNEVIDDIEWTPLLGAKVYFRNSKPTSLGLSEVANIVLHSLKTPDSKVDWGFTGLRIFAA